MTGRFSYALAPLLILLSSCDGDAITTESDLSDSEISDLERKARNGDIESAQILRTHYLFKNDLKNSDRYHEILLKMGDKAALEKESVILFEKSKSLSDINPNKIRILKSYFNMRQSIHDNGNSENDGILQDIHDELKRIEAKN